LVTANIYNTCLDSNSYTEPRNNEVSMSANGGPLTSNELLLTIKWTPQTGQLQVNFPQIDAVSILGMLEFAKVSLNEMRAKAEQRIAIPDMQITKRLIT